MSASLVITRPCTGVRSPGARRRTTSPIGSWLLTDKLPAQLARFVATGAATTLVQFGVFYLLYGRGEQVANLVAVILSSALANELHRRLTFRAGGRVTWLAAQWEGGALSATALATSSLALALLDDVVSDAWWAGALLIVAVNALTGLARFLLLRLWVFPTGPTAPRGRVPEVTGVYKVSPTFSTRTVGNRPSPPSKAGFPPGTPN